MKALLRIIILLFAISVQAQEIKEPKWFHLEGVNNPEYRVYLNETNIEYIPGVTIIADLKYGFFSDSLVSYSINKVKFLVPESTFQMLSNHSYYISKDGVQTEHVAEHVNPPSHPLIPGSEMSVIYQGVYIQAVTIGPTNK